MYFELGSDEQEKIIPLTESPDDVRKPVISLFELESLCEGNDILEEQLGDMLKSCLEYTITVANFKKTIAEAKGEITEEASDADAIRRSVHNKTMADINAFSRLLAKNHKDNTWMATAGMDGQNRAAYGKFALTITLSRI